MIIFCFFFSSRRRHTRWNCDWSSDVCSSDLFMHMELDVRRPTFVGDTLDVVVEITSSRASSKPGRGVVESRNTVYNERGDDVLVYTPVRLVRGHDFTP